MTLSVAIATFNEEKKIADCLESVKWADEIVIVDEKSSDETVQIAKKFTKKIFSVDHGSNHSLGYDTMFHKTKQLALDKCTCNWILSLDADERVTPELRDEIKKIIAANQDVSNFQIPRKNMIFGQWLEHTGWYPDYQIRLFRRGTVRWPCKSVHELIQVDGQTGSLKSDLEHFQYTSVEQFIDRLNRYTTNDANFLIDKGEKVVWSDAISFPADEFLRRFFFWEGYKDGLHGLVLSLLQVVSRLVVFCKMWERQGFSSYSGNNFLKDVELEIEKTISNWNHWSTVSEKNLLKKTIRKVINKLQ